MHARHSGLYEFCHRTFKAMYKKISKPATSAMEDTLTLRNKAARMSAQSYRHSTSQIAGDIRRHAAHIDGELLVKRGLIGTMEDIEIARRAVYSSERIAMRRIFNIRLLV